MQPIAKEQGADTSGKKAAGATKRKQQAEEGPARKYKRGQSGQQGAGCGVDDSGPQTQQQDSEEGAQPLGQVKGRLLHQQQQNAKHELQQAGGKRGRQVNQQAIESGDPVMGAEGAESDTHAQRQEDSGEEAAPKGQRGKGGRQGRQRVGQGCREGRGCGREAAVTDEAAAAEAAAVRDQQQLDQLIYVPGGTTGEGQGQETGASGDEEGFPAAGVSAGKCKEQAAPVVKGGASRGRKRTKKGPGSPAAGQAGPSNQLAAPEAPAAQQQPQLRRMPGSATRAAPAAVGVPAACAAATAKADAAAAALAVTADAAGAVHASELDAGQVLQTLAMNKGAQIPAGALVENKPGALQPRRSPRCNGDGQENKAPMQQVKTDKSLTTLMSLVCLQVSLL